MVEPYAKKENKAIIWDIRKGEIVLEVFKYETHRFMLTRM